MWLADQVSKLLANAVAKAEANDNDERQSHEGFTLRLIALLTFGGGYFYVKHVGHHASTPDLMWSRALAMVGRLHHGAYHIARA